MLPRRSFYAAVRLLAATWVVLIALATIRVAPAGALDLDPSPQRAPVRLPGDIFGGKGPVDGTVRVKIGVKKIKYSRVLETAPLTVPAGGDTNAAIRDLPLTAPDGKKELAFGRFNEVGLTLRDADPDNPSLAALAVRTRQGRSFVSDPLECVSRLGQAYLEAAAAPDASVPVARAEWADKTPLYLIRRVLDLPFDDAWHVAEDGPSTFLQRRFDRDLLDIGAVDLILRRPVPVQVNLVAALDPAHPRARTVLDWYGLAKRTFELPDGRTVLRVYVGRYLREHYAGIKAAKLKEISLMFFRQDAAEVRRDKVVERLVFTPSGLDAAAVAKDGLPGRLPTRVREPFTGVRRVFVNIAPAAAAMGASDTATATLRLLPMAPKLPGGASVEDAFLALVSPRRDTPAFLAAADELATSLGAAPDIDRPDGGVTVTPLWSLAAPFAPAQQRFAFGDARTETPVFVSGAPSLLSAPGGVRLYRTGQGLSVEGRADRLRIPVTAAFTPAADTAYFFRLDIGRAPGLSGVFLDVFETSGGKPARTYALRPGTPTRLDGLPPSVAGATLRFTFTGREFALPFTRAMLAAVPTGKPHQGLYAARLPWPVTTAARPDKAAGPGRFSPLTPFGRLSWLTAAYSLTGDPVAVSIAGGQPAIPDTRSGILAGRLADEPNAVLPGAVDVAVSGRDGRAPGSLELTRAAFSGQAQADWRAIFAAGPLLDLGGKRLSPGNLSEEAAARLHAADAWLDIGPADLPAQKASARFFSHPWYDVAGLCFETKAPIDVGRFAAPPHPRGAGHENTLTRALAAVALLAAVWLGLRLVGPARLRALAARPARWLATPPADPRDARREMLWGLGACAALLAVSLALSAAASRLVTPLAAMALLPVWRVLAPAVAARLSRRAAPLGAWLAEDPGRPYFLGFSLSLVFAAVLRLAMLARPAEFLVQAGLYCFLAGLYLELAPDRRETDANSARPPAS
ncbi:conserved hypothetical protein [Solidesulfovibrio fructosivorans JJ]]|uniref:Transmembrane protein n=1 Tax=Solidesulfovibrio fructosivorans JJ] TaxID=596151 RepID=E1JSI0_SOLFR|nr:hypothetical protein [Solidesulfovibrio fructosivorans]EFL52949.1 conserved hypothetical protein [Solidesulfovibrio fructosivorans JJ]]